MQLVGGADNLSAAIQAIVPVAGAAAAGLMLLAGAAAVTHIALGPVGWALAAVATAAAVAMGGMSYFTAQSINETRRLSNEQTQATQLYLRNKEEELRGPRDGGEEDGRGEPWLAGAGGGDPAELLQGPGRPEGQEQAAHRQ